MTGWTREPVVAEAGWGDCGAVDAATGRTGAAGVNGMGMADAGAAGLGSRAPAAAACISNRPVSAMRSGPNVAMAIRSPIAPFQGTRLAACLLTKSFGNRGRRFGVR